MNRFFIFLKIDWIVSAIAPDYVPSLECDGVEAMAIDE